MVPRVLTQELFLRTSLCGIPQNFSIHFTDLWYLLQYKNSSNCLYALHILFVQTLLFILSRSQAKIMKNSFQI